MRRHVCHVIPPHMLRQIVANCTTCDIRDHVITTLAISSRLRGRRDVMGLIAPALEVGTNELRRAVFDAEGVETLPGKLVRGEDGTVSQDVAVNEAYDGCGATHTLFSEVFGRNSIDDRGMRLNSTVHYGKSYDNAFWDGRQMVYGDGDGRIFNRFTIALDVIGHELTHGITQYEANLDYYHQSGALNESFSDVFGSIVKQYKLKQKFSEADWLIGAGLFTPHVRGVALRSMRLPGSAYDDPLLGKDPQPGHMKDFVHTTDDEGGVHINSGIPNHAFYLTCEALGDDIKSWEAPGQIWYVSLRDRLRRRSTFKDAAQILVKVSGELYGSKSKEQNATRKAWQAVGIAVK